MTTNSVVLNPSPKARFLANKTAVQAHNSFTKNEHFQQSLDFTLLEYQARLAKQSQEGNFNSHAASDLKMRGAMEFIQVFKELGFEIMQPTIVDRDNLTHQ